ncbi:MAG: sugar phosphate isomerase/epimerase [Clostridia bacterium]|nr:sugar phosphate isomerase/epimerase [Clostridia bacterium]
MKIAINNSVLLKQYTVEESLWILKNAGFDGADLSLHEILKDPAWQGDDYVEKAKALKAEADRIGFPILQAHAPFDSTIDYAENKFEWTKRSVEIAGICGAKCIVVHPIQYLSYFDDPKNADILFDINMEFYGRLKPIADQYGIKIATENMWRTNPKRQVIDHSVCSRPEEFCRYVDELQQRYGDTFTGCLDLGHMVLVGEDPCAMIRTMGSRIGALHVHDNDYRKDLHTIPGHGDMNFPAITEALKEIGYRGIYTLECGSSLPRELLPVGVSYMANIARHFANKIDS